MNRAMPFLLIFGGVLVMLCACLCWMGAYAVIMAGGGGEWHGILDTDKPAAYELLVFDDWHDGPGKCLPSHIHGFGKDYKIIEHRVGRADGVFTRFTYYEAQYLTPGGEERTTHATGPEPLIAPRRDTLWVMTMACLFGAFVLFRGAWK